MFPCVQSWWKRTDSSTLAVVSKVHLLVFLSFVISRVIQSVSSLHSSFSPPFVPFVIPTCCNRCSYLLLCWSHCSEYFFVCYYNIHVFSGHLVDKPAHRQSTCRQVMPVSNLPCNNYANTHVTMLKIIWIFCAYFRVSVFAVCRKFSGLYCRDDVD